MNSQKQLEEYEAMVAVRKKLSLEGKIEILEKHMDTYEALAEKLMDLVDQVGEEKFIHMGGRDFVGHLTVDLMVMTSKMNGMEDELNALDD